MGRAAGVLLDGASARESNRPADDTLSQRTHAHGRARSAFLLRLRFLLAEPLMGQRPAPVAGEERGQGGISGISKLTRLLSL